MNSLFSDGPEYTRRTKTPFKPTQVTLAELHAVVPKHLYEKSTSKGLYFVFRHVACVIVFYRLGLRIDSFTSACGARGLPILYDTTLRYALWATYWVFQGLAFTGFWCIAHEAGHGTLSPLGSVNTVIGFTLHTFLFNPYWSMRATHRTHHKNTMSLERDENHMPETRSELKLPEESIATLSDYHKLFEETPIYTLLRLLVMQLFGWNSYLLTNIKGNPSHPPGTNHFNPSSTLFKPHERYKIIASDIGLSLMAVLLYIWFRDAGPREFFRLYFVPYLCTTHWLVMLTYLNHTDPTVPLYRNKEWSFLRGAISTVDRPFLGWAGRFFLHNVSHDHTAHHLFSSIPFYNQPHVTEAIKKVLKDDYNYDSTNSFRALYRTFTQCCFVEDEGDIVFYRNKDGKPVRVLESDVLKH